MAIPQQTIPASIAFGLPGEIYDNGPTRVEPNRLVSVDATYNVFGRAFTYIASAGTQVQAGDPTTTGVFAGYLVNPKNFALQGNGSNALSPYYALPNNTDAPILREGEVIVQLDATSNIGDWIWFHQTTGILKVTAPGAVAPANHSFGYAQVSRHATGLGASLNVIRVSPEFLPPA